MLSASPLDFMRKALPHFMCQICILEGEKRKQARDFIQDTVFHQVLLLLQASKFRKLLIPKYQLLLFSFQLSFISWFRDTLSLSRGDVPPLTPISPTADREAHPAGKGRLVATSRDMPEDSATQY